MTRQIRNPSILVAERLVRSVTGRVLRKTAGYCVLLVACLSLGCASGTRGPHTGAVLEGRVTRDGNGVMGARVSIVSPRLHFTQKDPRPEAEVLSRRDGAFRLPAPRGAYLVTARAGNWFAYFGRNPVQLDSRLTGIHLPLIPAHASSRAPVLPGEEGIWGAVLLAGRPVAGARVFVYVDPSRGLRGPGYARSEPTGPDGAYHIPLPPGSYFLAARLRSGGRKTGPLEPGDLFGVFPEFPLVLSRGQGVQADIETVTLPNREQMTRFRGNFSQISGHIVDRDGSPVSGLRACLYRDVQMLDRPFVVSQPAGPDGAYVIRNVLAGSYYLGARETLGGPPAPGERVGFYHGPQGTRIRVELGVNLEGLALVVQVVP